MQSSAYVAIIKIVAEVELLMPSYGFCSIPANEEFSESVCDEFFSLPIFPQVPYSDPCPTKPGCFIGCTPAT